MNKDRIKERLAHIRNIQTHTWSGMLVSAAGSFGLFWTVDTLLARIFFVVGILLFAWLLSVYLNRNEAIENIIQQLED